jgi:hypothetical protein
MKRHKDGSDLGAVPSDSTIYTFQFLDRMDGKRSGFNHCGFLECVFDGVEIGSTDIGDEVEITG